MHPSKVQGCSSHSLYQRDIATSIVSEEKPGDFNQALMELGARICTPQKPSCDICPVKEYCHAVKQLETHLRMKSEKFVNNSKKRRRSVDHSKLQCGYPC